jgi:cytochrome P450
MTTVELPSTFYDDAPMAADRTAAMDYLRRPGDVYKAGDLWYLTSYDAVRYAQKHPELFSSARAFDYASAAIHLIPIAIDPPLHARYRRVLDPMFGPKRIDEIEQRLRAQLRAHIDAFAGAGHCDVVADLAVKFPTQALLTLFGLPVDDLPQFMDWVDGFIKNTSINAMANDPTPRQVECSVALFGYLQEHLSIKKANPGNDVLSDVLALTGDDAWSDAEILGMCFLMVLAGLDTVAGTMGFCFFRLAADAELRQRLVNDPALISPFVEEVLRLDGALPIVPRVTTTEVEIAGTVLPADAHVVLLLATANRDGPRADDPNQLHFTDRSTHLGFGGGIHRCLGSHLARRELRLAIEEFHARISDYRLAATPTVVWPAGTVHLKSLLLEFPVN